MGRKDKKMGEKIAFDVLLRNTITSGENPSIDYVVPDPGGLGDMCNQSAANVSVRSTVCDIVMNP